MVDEEDDYEDGVAEIDRMGMWYPGGKIYVSGRNASKAFWMVFVVSVILALGSALPNIIEAWRRQ